MTTGDRPVLIRCGECGRGVEVTLEWIHRHRVIDCPGCRTIAVIDKDAIAVRIARRECRELRRRQRNRRA